MPQQNDSWAGFLDELEAESKPRATTPDDVASSWAGFEEEIKPLVPKKTDLGRFTGMGALGAGVLDSLAAIPKLAGRVVDILGETEPATAGGARPLPGGQRTQYRPMGEALVAPIVEPMDRASQAAYPPEARAEQSLPERLIYGAGQLGGALPAMALGPAGAATQFGAMNALPLYYETKAKTGDDEAANWALLGGFAIGQLERFGAEKALAGVVKKMTPAVSGLVRRAMVALGTGVQETGTDVAQQALTDKLYEVLTGEDIANLQRIEEGLPASAIMGTGIGVMTQALRGTPSAVRDEPTPELGQETAQEAPGAEIAPDATATPPAGAVTPQASAGVVESSGADMLGPDEVPTAPVGKPPAVEGSGQQVGQPAADTVAAKPTLSLKKRTPAPEPELDAEQLAPDKAPTPDEEPSTGIKNASVEAELEKMGLDAPPPSKRSSFVELHARAKEKFQADQHAGSKLIDDLEATNRAPSDEEGALLAFEANRLVNEVDAAQTAYLKEPSAARQAALEKAQGAYDRAADVLKKAGRESGASLNVRKMMLKRDYSLAAMTKAVRVAKGGAKLTREESAKVQELHAELDAATKAHEAYVTKSEMRIAELEAQQALDALKAEVAKQPKSLKRKADIEKTKQEIKELYEALGKHTSGQLFAGPDTQTIVLTTKLAGKVIKLGAQSFAQWSDEMVARFGEKIRPHLKPAWEQAEKEAAEGLPAQHKRMESKIKDLERRIAEKDFEPKGRKPRPLDKETVRLKADVEAAKKKFEREKERHRRENRTAGERAKDVAKEILDLPRAIFSSFDFSAVRRQGGFFTSGHPLRSARHAQRMFEAFKNPRAALEADVAIRNRPGHELADAAGLELTSTDDIGPQEEAIRSHWSDKIPGMKGSNRAYVTYLNAQRAAAFDALVESLPHKPTLDEAKALADFVNVATGRASGRGKKLAAVIEQTKLLWAPSYAISRFQVLGRPITMLADKRLSRAAKRAIGREYARAVAGQSVYYALLGALAVGIAEEADEKFSVELDPRSSDVGKIRIGRVRLDPLAGMAQVGVLLSRLVSGKTKTTTTGKVKSLGGKGPFDESRMDVITRFARSKLGPVPSRIVDALSGETFIGEKVTPPEALLRPPIPGALHDTYQAMKELGVPPGIILGVFSLLGDSLQTHEKKKAK